MVVRPRRALMTIILHPPMYNECQATSIYLVPFVVPVYRRRPAYYNTDVWYEYDLTIYFGAGDGGWMNSTIKYKRRGNSGEGRSIASGNYGVCHTITRECASERGVDILRIWSQDLWLVSSTHDNQPIINVCYTTTTQYMTTAVDTTTMTTTTTRIQRWR